MVKTRNIYLLVGIVIYKVLCDYAYDNIISRLFDYQRFENDATFKSMCVSWFMLLLLSPLIVKTNFEQKLSSGIMKVLILISLIPTCTMIGFHSSYETEYIVLIFLYWLLFLIANLYMPKIVINNPGFGASLKLDKIFIVFLCLAIIFISWRYTGFRFQYDIYNVYDVRVEARGYEIGTLLGYLLTFADNILPIALVYSLYKKKKFTALFISLIIFLNFGISASKQVMFLLFLSLLGYYFIKDLKYTNRFVWVFVGLLSFGILEFTFLNTFVISLFSTYRVFFIPAKLHYSYYEFFSQNELDYFRQSFFKLFLESPYKDNIGFIIGHEDSGEWGGRANNGLFSDAYYNFGIVGVITFPVLVVILMKLLDGSVKGLNERFLFIIVISVSFILNNLPFSTALFSAGLGALIVYLNLLKRESI